MTQPNCPNCNSQLHGQYCSQCGQNQKGSDRYLLTLINEAFEGVFSLDSKAWRTTIGMLFRPGFLTKEHFAGRRARYISPLRLYLITSIGFFLTLSILNFFSSNIKFELNDDIQTISSETEKDSADKTLNNMDIQVLDWDIPFINNDTQTAFKATFNQKIRNAIKIAIEHPKRVISKLIDTAPPIAFVLLPLFALLLKLFYLSSRKFYTEHLVLAMHNHCFLFSAMTLITLTSVVLRADISEWITFALSVYIIAYMTLSLKNVFAQRWSTTIAKTAMLFIFYVILIAAGVTLVSLIGIILL